MTLLAAVDGKQLPNPVIQLSADLATELSEELVVLYVSSNDEESEEDAEQVARHQVENTLTEWEHITCIGRVGDPAQQILAEAESYDPRYIFVGGRKRSAVGKAVFGSISQSVLLNSNHPVIVVPKDVDALLANTGPIVAAIDRSDRAELVVEQAHTLATALERDLHVLHVFPFTEWLDRHRDRIEQMGSGGVQRAEVQEAALDLAKSAGSAVTDSFTPVGKVDDPGSGIFDYNSDVDASYVVIAGRKRTPVGKVLLGSVTQSVILNGDRPVLTIMVEP